MRKEERKKIMASKQGRNSWENSSEERNLVTFRLGQQLYALPIDPVAQIVEMVAITRIPQVNHAVAGVINYHGVSVPVVDLGRHLSQPTVPPGLDTHIIVITVEERLVGLVVDQVLEVIDLLPVQISPLEAILPQGLGQVPLLEGLAHTAEGTVLLLDPERLFSSQTMQSFAQTIEALQDLPETVAA
jgi:purine-binding chemotaxis protein CheW